ncbi:unnamed protein product [Mesocestoides corti]|uniref:SKA2 domain-containing protein n=1 Tax=Mesocestoides corti TaxID=53468 RepID=A0A0R3U3H2_MESCO|nr:unnamed protein product [Mesocestoides corti]
MDESFDKFLRSFDSLQNHTNEVLDEDLGITDKFEEELEKPDVHTDEITDQECETLQKLLEDAKLALQKTEEMPKWGADVAAPTREAAETLKFHFRVLCASPVTEIAQSVASQTAKLLVPVNRLARNEYCESKAAQYSTGTLYQPLRSWLSARNSKAGREIIRCENQHNVSVLEQAMMMMMMMMMMMDVK